MGDEKGEMSWGDAFWEYILDEREEEVEKPGRWRFRKAVFEAETSDSDESDEVENPLTLLYEDFASLFRPLEQEEDEDDDDDDDDDDQVSVDDLLRKAKKSRLRLFRRSRNWNREEPDTSEVNEYKSFGFIPRSSKERRNSFRKRKSKRDEEEVIERFSDEDNSLLSENDETLIASVLQLKDDRRPKEKPKPGKNVEAFYDMSKDKKPKDPVHEIRIEKVLESSSLSNSENDDLHKPELIGTGFKKKRDDTETTGSLSTTTTQENVYILDTSDERPRLGDLKSYHRISFISSSSSAASESREPDRKSSCARSEEHSVREGESIQEDDPDRQDESQSLEKAEAIHASHGHVEKTVFDKEYATREKPANSKILKKRGLRLSRKKGKKEDTDEDRSPKDVTEALADVEETRAPSVAMTGKGSRDEDHVLATRSADGVAFSSRMARSFSRKASTKRESSSKDKDLLKILSLSRRRGEGKETSASRVRTRSVVSDPQRSRSLFRKKDDRPRRSSSLSGQISRSIFRKKEASDDAGQNRNESTPVLTSSEPNLSTISSRPPLYGTESNSIKTNQDSLKENEWDGYREQSLWDDWNFQPLSDWEIDDSEETPERGLLIGSCYEKAQRPKLRKGVSSYSKRRTRSKNRPEEERGLLEKFEYTVKDRKPRNRGEAEDMVQEQIFQRRATAYDQAHALV